jgi:hypothetical protein
VGDARFCINHKLAASIDHCLTRPTATALFIKIYDLLQLQFKTHSVLLRLAAEGRASRFFWQLLEAATGAASASHRATTPWIAPTKHYNARKEREIAATAEDCAAGELISHGCTAAGQQPRQPVGATRNKPAVGPAYNGPGTGLLRRVQDRTSSSFASIHARDRCLWNPCQSFHQLS